jgi:predicted RNA-binding Zn-ribbon protein involved in translation (DUF1610 family)
MERRKCISCGFLIFKSARTDPYMCRDCEEMMVSDDARYAYLDFV